jgi:WD40 repeat protein
VTNRLATFNVHEGQKVSSLQLLPGRAELLLQSGEDVEVRDTRSWRVTQAFDSNQEARGSRSASRFLLSVKRIVEIGFSSDGITVSGVIPEDGVRLWDSRTGGVKRAQEITISNGLIARSANGKLLGEATAQSIKLWDLATGVAATLPRAGSTRVSAFALSPDGKLLALAEGPQIKLRSSTDESLSHSLAHETVVELLAFSNDGRMLVSADESGTIKIWEVNEGQLKQSISTGNIVTALAIDPSGQYLASAGADYLISVWNAATAAPLLRLKKHENVINALVFSPDGKMLASGSDDRVAVIWDIMAGKSRQTLKGHDLTVSSLAFSPDGQLLATGSGNASVVLWNVNNGKLERVLR